ncbi:hypothetical protein RND71_002010 [Anisodus tanguticus]|uniref:Uncharacterized protein n=1 Tax=Anisodus tanguticus TaxID=243964 RepID=A0AAE1T2B1_9SOLA|nr:hypothetical protein RND71_002010 [Anisodus tanguticus]
MMCTRAILAVPFLDPNIQIQPPAQDHVAEFDELILDIQNEDAIFSIPLNAPSLSHIFSCILETCFRLCIWSWPACPFLDLYHICLCSHTHVLDYLGVFGCDRLIFSSALYIIRQLL